jgi:hypothetical protein
MEPADHGLKPLKPSAKVNISSYKLFLSDIVSQQQKDEKHST